MREVCAFLASFYLNKSMSDQGIKGLHSRSVTPHYQLVIVKVITSIFAVTTESCVLIVDRMEVLKIVEIGLHIIHNYNSK